MHKKRVSKGEALSAPEDLSGASDYISQIGEAQRAIEQINVDMNAKLEEIKGPFVAQAEEQQKNLEKLVAGLYDYASKNRKKLIDDEKQIKTVTLPAGSFRWRFTPKSVSIKDAKKVLAQLKKLNLTQFIRTKEELDKKAMLKDEASATAVSGITISQTEEFVIKPAETRVEVLAVKNKGGLKIAVSSK